MPKTRLHYHRPALHSRRPQPISKARAKRLHTLAEGFSHNGMLDAAVDSLRRAVVLDSANPDLRLALASRLYHTGSFDAALAWLGSLSDARRPDAELLRGRILTDLKKTDEAIAAFKRVLELDPKRQEARLLMAQAQLAANRADEAVANLEEFLRHRPDESSALMLRARAYLAKGQPQLAIRDLAAIRPTDRTAAITVYEARARLVAGHSTEEIERTYREGLAAFPADHRLRLSWARHLISRRAVDPAARERAAFTLEGLIDELAAGPSNTPLLVEALFALGALRSDDPADHDRAEELYRRGLAMAPADPVGLAGLGALLLRRGRPASALTWLLSSLLADPERQHTIALFAAALCATLDDEAVARWVGMLAAGLPRQAPTVLAQVLRGVAEAGRNEALEEVRREAHRMKNLVAVLGSRLDAPAQPDLRHHVENLYHEWTTFLDRIRSRPAASTVFTVESLLHRALEETAADRSRIRVSAPPGLPLIEGDAVGCATAIANLLRNALEASVADEPVILAARFLEGSRCLEISITNYGSGISLADQPRIFEAGYSTKPNGSGMGLSIAQRAIAAHGGRITLQSAPGGPTRFTIRLPIAAPHPTVAGASPRPAASPFPSKTEDHHAG